MSKQTLTLESFRQKREALAEVLAAVEVVGGALPHLSTDERQILLRSLKDLIENFDEKKPAADLFVATANGDKLPTPSEAAEELLRRHPEGLKAGDVVKQLVGKFATKGDPRKIAYSSLIYLRRKGVIKKSADGTYTLVTR